MEDEFIIVIFLLVFFVTFSTLLIWASVNRKRREDKAWIDMEPKMVAELEKFSGEKVRYFTSLRGQERAHYVFTQGILWLIFTDTYVGYTSRNTLINDPDAHVDLALRTDATLRHLRRNLYEFVFPMVKDKTPMTTFARVEPEQYNALKNFLKEKR